MVEARSATPINWTKTKLIFWQLKYLIKHAEVFIHQIDNIEECIDA